MSDDTVTATLKILRDKHDPRLPQYVVSLHQPDGWSLAQIGDAMGTSREWVRVLEVRGLKQMSEGDLKNLSDLPTYTRRNRRRQIAVAYSLPPETVEVLKALNEDCVRWRNGKDDTGVRAFNKIVQMLLDGGVPMNAVARAVGQPTRSFRRRMNRWGVVGPNNPPQDWVLSPSPEKDRKSLTIPENVCDDPTCPIPGTHVHA